MDVCDPTDAAAEARILIVDDHAAIRNGLTQLLGQEADLTVCGAVESAERALQVMQQQPIDLAIVDISLGQMDGIELTQRLRLDYPNLRILVFSMHDPSHYAERALNAGASGFVAKQEACDILLLAVRNVLAGRTYVSSTRGLCA